MAKKRILIVEDEGVVGLDIKKRLIKLGYDAIGPFSRGNTAIEQVELHAPDLVLTDIVLKGNMNGIEVAQIISSRSSIPIIFLTAH